MKIVMVGTGYVGLVSGVCFSEFGHDVICVDRDAGKIKRLRDGEIPIYEPDLDALVARNVNAGRLTFTTDLGAAAGDADAVFIAVGTPSRRGDGQADLSYVFKAAEEVAGALDHYAVIVTKSTVPIGTNRLVADIVRRSRPDLEFDVASNPEFLREGAAIEDFMKPDRIVVGTDCARARDVMAAIYAPLSDRGYPLIATDIESAEMIKYAANAFLAMKITFINEVAGLCESVGADVTEVARGMGLDSRIGARFLDAGPGYGGSCFPKDTLAFARTGQKSGHPLRLVESTIEINKAVKARMVDKIVTACGGSIEGKRIAVLGATFKAETDDMRDAPSLTILPRLIERGASVEVVDPQGRSEGERLLPGVAWGKDAYSAAHGADALVVLTEWAEFRNLDLARLAGGMRTPVLADLRNLFSEEAARAAGFASYTSIGRGSAADDPATHVVALHA